MKRITAIEVGQIKKPGRYPVGNGVYLQITGERGRSWIFRYERQGRGHLVGLGPVALVTLAEARARGHDLRRQLLDGKDPLEERKSKRRVAAVEAAKAVSFRECAE